HADNLPADQFLAGIEGGDLRAALADTKLRSEVGLDLVSRFAGFREFVHGHNGAHPQFHPLKLIPSQIVLHVPSHHKARKSHAPDGFYRGAVTSWKACCEGYRYSLPHSAT